MQPLDFIAPWYYGTYYNILFLLLCWSTVLYYIGSSQQKILQAEGNNPMQGMALLLTVVLIFYIGLRPQYGGFADMYAYRFSYLNTISDYQPVSLGSEWLWNNLNVVCKKGGLSVHEFFLVVAVGYFLGMFICSVLLVRNNLWMAVLFFYMSFSCYSYATNGIRNGLSCSIELVAIALLAAYKKSRLFALFLMFLAMGIHRSIMLPSMAALASVYFIKDTKTALRLWWLAIPLSLAAGPIFTQFFAALGFDDRMTEYTTTEGGGDYLGGFRWDFLFYSLFPVVMVWYVTEKRKFTDRTYQILANTYLLSNAFWILVIRASFSNRFAYLSWFIHPMVMLYPLVRMNLWKDQDRKTALALFLYTGFSFFMFFIYYFGTMSGFRGFNQYWWK